MILKNTKEMIFKEKRNKMGHLKTKGNSNGGIISQYQQWKPECSRMTFFFKGREKKLNLELNIQLNNGNHVGKNYQ